jgi:ATP-binding cassette, subfamily B, bacterial
MLVTWGVGSADNELRYMQDLLDYLDLPEGEPKNVTGIAIPALHGSQPPTIRFEDVTFTYPGVERPALIGINLTIAPGERLALVGENGAGKTTLAKLLLGLYHPTSGRITINGADMAALPPGWWQARVAAVFQDYVRYELTARENIGFGNLAQLHNRSAIDLAAARSGADRVIATLPAGYETVLGKAYDESGQDLSLGQWQKLAIARAYLRDGAVLVLDEPTAALDARAEVEVYQQFRDMAQGRTTLLISHRLGSARLADRILVLDNGRIVEQGQHMTLLAHDGRYATMYRIQAHWYQ